GAAPDLRPCDGRSPSHEGDREPMRPDHLIILAGGKATRLGPLTATMNKALVTVGQQPMIIQQILGMDIDDVTVVVSPGSRDQVVAMCTQALPDRYEIAIEVQP